MLFRSDGTCGRSSESNDTDLLLSGCNCGEDEFLSNETVSYRIGTGIMIYCVYAMLKIKEINNRIGMQYKYGKYYSN